MLAVLKIVAWLLMVVVLVLLVFSMVLALVYFTLIMIEDMGLIYWWKDWKRSRRKE